MTNKKYFWFKLKNTYFNQLTQKKMKRQEHGKDMQIIYLRMILLSLDKDGFILYQGVYDSLEEELSEEFDEPVEMIHLTVNFLIENNMMSVNENDNSFFIPEALECTGSECESAERVRKHREEKKKLQCNKDVTQSNEMKHREEKKRTETDIYLKSDNSKTLDNISKTETEQAGDDFVDRQTVSAAANAEPSDGDLFSMKQLVTIAKKNKINMDEEGIQAFFDTMQEDNWTLWGKPVEKKYIVRTMRAWIKRHPEYNPEEYENDYDVNDEKEITAMDYMDYMKELGILDEEEI